MQITPLITFITVLLAIFPCLMKAWRNPQPRMISRWVSYAYTCGFLFGWHVHEKASLHFVIPLALTSLKSVEDAKHYFFLSIGIINLYAYMVYLLWIDRKINMHLYLSNSCLKTLLFFLHNYNVLQFDTVDI